MLLLALTAFLVLYLALQLGLAGVLRRPLLPAPHFIPGSDRTPPVGVPLAAVLVAARNEEANLPRCLAALAALDYPPDRLRVLIADDGSTDATPAILREFARDRPNWQILTIAETLGHARGKANALAHLIRAADTELMLCCDADVAVPPSWARTLINAAYQSQAGLVVGTTLITGNDWLARAQSIDWLRALAFLQIAARLGRPFTGMGNNQLLRASAYRVTGGYEQLPFSVTEDFQLFLALRQHGWHTVHLLEPGALGWSTPIESVGALLRQRRRWLRGLLQTPTRSLLLAAVVEAGFYPALVGVLLLGPPTLAAALWAGRLLAHVALLRPARHHLHLPPPTPADILYLEGYLIGMAVLLPLVGLWPGKVRWKGREL